MGEGEGVVVVRGRWWSEEKGIFGSLFGYVKGLRCAAREVGGGEGGRGRELFSWLFHCSHSKTVD